MILPQSKSNPPSELVSSHSHKRRSRKVITTSLINSISSLAASAPQLFVTYMKGGRMGSVKRKGSHVQPRTSLSRSKSINLTSTCLVNASWEPKKCDPELWRLVNKAKVNHVTRESSQQWKSLSGGLHGYVELTTSSSDLFTRPNKTLSCET